MPKGIEIVGFGAGAHDFFRPVGDIDDDHVPGAKKSEWTDREDRLLQRLREAGCETHVGGNVLNALVYLACRSTLQPDVRFVSALGHDSASDAIRTELQRFGITRITNTPIIFPASVSSSAKNPAVTVWSKAGRVRRSTITSTTSRSIGPRQMQMLSWRHR